MCRDAALNKDFFFFQNVFEEFQNIIFTLFNIEFYEDFLGNA